MAKAIFSQGAATSSQGAGLTHYRSFGAGQTTSSTTESDCQWTNRTAGTYSYFQTYVTTNSLSGDYDVTLRVNTADVTSTVKYTTGQTGNKIDTTHSDTISAGNVMSCKHVTAAGSGSVTLTTIRGVFNASSGTARRVGGVRPNIRTFSVASTDSPIGMNTGLNTAQPEAGEVWQIRGTQTLENIFARISTNGRTTDTLVISRKNSADGTLILTYTSGQTGVKEDNASPDSLTSLDLVCLMIRTSTGTGNFDAQAITAELKASNSTSMCGSPAGTINTSLTRYFHTDGGGVATVEAETQMTAGCTQTASLLQANVTANGLTSDANIKFKKNGSDATMIVTYTSGQTGWKDDTTNSDAYTPTDLIGLTVVTGATGTSITIRNASFLTTDASSTSIKTFDGLAYASVKTVDGLAIASVKTANGLA